MNKKDETKITLITSLISIVVLMQVLDVFEKLLPEPFSFIIPAIILVPCGVYLFYKITEK